MKKCTLEEKNLEFKMCVNKIDSKKNGEWKTRLKKYLPEVSTMRIKDRKMLYLIIWHQLLWPKYHI
jgi:hypothetical protein